MNFDAADRLESILEERLQSTSLDSFLNFIQKKEEEEGPLEVFSYYRARAFYQYGGKKDALEILLTSKNKSAKAYLLLAEIYYEDQQEDALESIREIVENLYPGSQEFKKINFMNLLLKKDYQTLKDLVDTYPDKDFELLKITYYSRVGDTDRSALVGSYIGQTAPKTLDVCKSAYGGILFIDEAYSLADGGSNDFGKEALATLIQEMENNRDKILVILAGYSHEMGRLFDLNPGLKSRVGNIIEFPDYSGEDMVKIFNLTAKNASYHLEEEAQDLVRSYFNDLVQNKDKNFGNGREARAFFERLTSTQASRVVQTRPDDIFAISREDVVKTLGGCQ